MEGGESCGKGRGDRVDGGGGGGRDSRLSRDGVASGMSAIMFLYVPYSF